MAAVTATSITISESGENWVVDWDASAVDDDIAGWYVCYNKGEFTANEMQVLIDQGLSDGNGCYRSNYPQVYYC